MRIYGCCCAFHILYSVHMVSKENRFHGQGSVRYVLRRGQTARGSSLTLKYVRKQRHANWRAGVVVSRKVCKSSPKRNRIRRRIYEVLRTWDPPIPGDADLIVLVFDESVATMPSETLKEQLKQLLKQADIS